MEINNDKEFIFEVDAEFVNDVDTITHALSLTPEHSRDSPKEIEAELLRSLLEYQIEGEWAAADLIHLTLTSNTHLTVVEHALPVYESLCKAEFGDFPEYTKVTQYLKRNLAETLDQVFFDGVELSHRSRLMKVVVCFEKLD